LSATFLLVAPTFLRLSLPSTFFLICTLFDFGLLSAALFLSSLLCFGLLALFRRQPRLRQCVRDVRAKLIDPKCNLGRRRIQVPQTLPLLVLAATDNCQQWVFAPSATCQRRNRDVKNGKYEVATA
jgi:hypothetical protein